MSTVLRSLLIALASCAVAVSAIAGPPNEGAGKGGAGGGKGGVGKPDGDKSEGKRDEAPKPLTEAEKKKLETCERELFEKYVQTHGSFQDKVALFARTVFDRRQQFAQQNADLIAEARTATGPEKAAKIRAVRDLWKEFARQIVCETDGGRDDSSRRGARSNAESHSDTKMGIDGER